ncbi:MAG TPA: hypothetical protein VGL75_06330 [Acidothermaceae bacterium]
MITVPWDDIAAKAGAPAHDKPRILRGVVVLVEATVPYAATRPLALSRHKNMEGNP